MRKLTVALFYFFPMPWGIIFCEYASDINYIARHLLPRTHSNNIRVRVGEWDVATSADYGFENYWLACMHWLFAMLVARAFAYCPLAASLG